MVAYIGNPLSETLALFRFFSAPEKKDKRRFRGEAGDSSPCAGTCRVGPGDSIRGKDLREALHGRKPFEEPPTSGGRTYCRRIIRIVVLPPPDNAARSETGRKRRGDLPKEGRPQEPVGQCPPTGPGRRPSAGARLCQRFPGTQGLPEILRGSEIDGSDPELAWGAKGRFAFALNRLFFFPARTQRVSWSKNAPARPPPRPSIPRMNNEDVVPGPPKDSGITQNVKCAGASPFFPAVSRCVS
jgi:hypothetical protein